MNEIIDARYKRFFHKFYMLLSVQSVQEEWWREKIGKSLRSIELKLKTTGK